MILEMAPVLAIVLPLISAFVLPGLSLFTGKRTRESLSLVTMTMTFLMTILTFMNVTGVERHIQIYRLGGWAPPIGIVLEIDYLNALVGLLLGFMLLLLTIFSIGYLSRDDGLQYYYILLMSMSSGFIGCVYTGDLFNLFVFLEIASISSYGLVAFRKDHADSLEAAFKYLIMSALALNIYYFATTLLYSSYGTLNMADLAAKIHGETGSSLTGVSDLFGITKEMWPSAVVVLAMAIWAFSIKGSIAPLHFAHVDAAQAAPSTVSAMFSGVMTAAAFYVIMRFTVTLYGGATTIGNVGNMILTLLLTLGLASMIIGSLLTLVQEDLKRLLAFSTVANAGYVVFGIGLLAFEQWPLSSRGLIPLEAAVLHLVNHTIVKVLLFLCAGAILFVTGSRRIDELGGLGKRMPFLAICYSIGALAIVGVPTLNCFVSKWLLIVAAIDKADALHYISAVIIVATSAIMLGAQLRVIYGITAGVSRVEIRTRKLPLTMMIPIAVLTLLAVILGVYPQVIMSHVEDAARAMVNPDYWKYVWGLFK
jgi:multicomponent Na+:H+ antiporter subunit D